MVKAAEPVKPKGESPAKLAARSDGSLGFSSGAPAANHAAVL
jgi:hypothetical protein